MALDPSIILGNRGVDVVGAMGAGNALAAQTNQLQQQNALAQLYKTQGAGIMNGDPSALNALAAIDPAAGQGFQAGALGMDQTRQQMAILDENTKRAAEEYARGLSAEQKAAEAAQIEAGVKQALMAPTPEAFDAMMIQMGHPDMVGQFENREALAAQFMSVAEIMKTITPPATDPLKGAPEGYMFLDPNNPAAGVVPIPGMPVSGPEWRAATPEEAAANGAVAGQINTKTGKFDAQNPPSNMSLSTNPDGTMTLVQGPGAGRTAAPTSAVTTEAQKGKMAYESLTKGLDDYEAIFKRTGGAVMPGADKDALLAARRGLQLQMKELYNLGVLNGPDLSIMDALLVDATSVENNALDAFGVADLDGRVTANLTQLRKMFKDLVEPKIKALGGEVPGSGSQPPAAGFDQAEIDQLMIGP